MPLEQLHRFVTAIAPLKADEWEAFSALWQPFACGRKTLLTAPGETERYLYFVLEGVQRSYFTSNGGRESTLIFTYAPSFSGVVDSLLTQTPSPYGFETLTASRFLRTTQQQLQDALQRHPALQALVLKATAFALKGVLSRMTELQTAGAEEKFRNLMARSPHLLHLVPHKYLASYLALDATTFSKLLGTVRIGGKGDE